MEIRRGINVAINAAYSLERWLLANFRGNDKKGKERTRRDIQEENLASRRQERDGGGGGERGTGEERKEERKKNELSTGRNRDGLKERTAMTNEPVSASSRHAARITTPHAGSTSRARLPLTSGERPQRCTMRRTRVRKRGRRRRPALITRERRSGDETVREKERERSAKRNDHGEVGRVQ